jgi:hypothetical protein
MYRTIETLHEYRLRYPDTAAVPTLTQSGLLGLLLAAQDRKTAELARRRAMWKRIWGAPAYACGTIRRAFAAAEFHHNATPVEVAARPHA